MTIAKRQRLKKFEKALIKSNGNQSAAYKSLHPNASNSTARTKGSELVKKNPQIIENIVKKLENNDLGQDRLCKKLKKLVDAKKNLVVNGKIHRVNDNATQLSAMTTAFRLHGHLSSNVNIKHDNRQVNINSVDLDHRQLSLLTLKLSQLHRALNLEDEQDGEVIDADFSAGDATETIEDTELTEYSQPEDPPEDTSTTISSSIEST